MNGVTDLCSRVCRGAFADSGSLKDGESSVNGSQILAFSGGKEVIDEDVLDVISSILG